MVYTLYLSFKLQFDFQCILGVEFHTIKSKSEFQKRLGLVFKKKKKSNSILNSNSVSLPTKKSVIHKYKLNFRISN